MNISSKKRRVSIRKFFWILVVAIPLLSLPLSAAVPGGGIPQGTGNTNLVVNQSGGGGPNALNPPTVVGTNSTVPGTSVGRPLPGGGVPNHNGYIKGVAVPGGYLRDFFGNPLPKPIVMHRTAWIRAYHYRTMLRIPSTLQRVVYGVGRQSGASPTTNPAGGGGNPFAGASTSGNGPRSP